MSGRILILGGSGLIGHQLWRILSKRFSKVYVAIHGTKASLRAFGNFESDSVFELFEAMDDRQVESLLKNVSPEVVLNCVGITKRKKEINSPLLAISINCLLPHKLANWALSNGRRLIHFSTDCVFNGSEGDYTEDSLTTAEDMYGRTKAIGEVRSERALTIRSSFIGRELSGNTELLEWLIGQQGKTVRGFTRAMYSGVSTIVMSRIVADIIENHADLSGLMQLAVGKPISKYDLLCLARDAFNLDIQIDEDDSFETKPTLDGSRLHNHLGYKPPTWREMMTELAADNDYYKAKKENANSPI